MWDSPRVNATGRPEDPERQLYKFWERFHLEMSNEEAYAHMQSLIIHSQTAFVPQMVPPPPLPACSVSLAAPALPLSSCWHCLRCALPFLQRACLVALGAVYGGAVHI